MTKRVQIQFIFDLNFSFWQILMTLNSTKTHYVAIKFSNFYSIDKYNCGPKIELWPVEHSMELRFLALPIYLNRCLRFELCANRIVFHCNLFSILMHNQGTCLYFLFLCKKGILCKIILYPRWNRVKTHSNLRSIIEFRL